MLRCSFIVDPRTVTQVFAFLLTVLLCAPAGAQTPAPPPIFPAVDANGVDLATGAFNHSQTDVVIGQPGAGGLAFTRSYQSGPNAYWTNNHMGYVYANGATCSVVIGTFTETFTSGSNCTGSFTSNQQHGSTLSYNGSTYTYTASDGTIAVFNRLSAPLYGAYAFLNMPEFLPGVAYLVSVTSPAGDITSYGYDTSTPPCPYSEWWECESWVETTYYRLMYVQNSSGYRLWFDYPGPPEAWVQPNRVTGINLAVEFCYPGYCAQPWPSATYTYSDSLYLTATNALGATTSYAYSGYHLTEVQFPDHADHDLNIAYASSRVASVDLGFGTWSYAYVDASGDRTTTVTHPGGATRRYVSTIATGRIKSVTNELNQTLTYQYDGAARQTRVTQPEGNYTQYAYDSRGNITETRQVSKTPGTPADIVTSAAYPGSCTNPRTCNQPTSTTDARGYRTDYTYDATHGGVLTVTAPASSGATPVGAGDRPQIRLTYAQFQARYLNPAGWTNGTAVWRRTATSACGTGTAPGCLGTANETVATVAYPGSGTPNNVLPASQTTAAGNGSISATTALTYTNWSDVRTIDGPLAGTADTTRFYYDAGRRITGVVGPESGARHRAVRTTYNTIGQPTLIERGAVPNQSNTAFLSFTLLEMQETLYDPFARPIQARLWGGGAIVALTQFNYDARGRALCTAVRLNPATFTSPPSDACALGGEGAFGKDRITRTGYDAASRAVQAESGVGTALAQTTAAQTYTSNGQIATLTDARGFRTSYEYDGFDRLVKRRYPDPNYPNLSSATDYEELAYDAFGRILQERNRGGDWFAFGYDNLNRLTLRDAPGGQPDVSFAQDLLGRTIAESQFGNALNTAYDALSRVTSVTSSVLGTVSYQYDAAGRRTRLTYPDGFYVTYAYNTADDLTDIRQNGTTSLAEYRYDDFGRRTDLELSYGTTKVETEYSYDALSRLATLEQNPKSGTYDTIFSFAYNPASQLTSRTRSNGVFDYLLPGSFSESYTADGLNRYTSALGVTPTYGLRGNLTYDGTNTYTYDVDNRLVATSSGASLGYDPLGRLHEVSAAGATTRFLYDGADVIAEYNASGTVLRRYVHGPGTDEPLLWYEGAGTGDRRYLLADERGSIIGVTDGNGTVTQVNRYDAYGVPNPANQGRFQYTGQMWLAEVGLYHYKARLYHPRLGRFMQTDPIGTAGGMNLYAYTGNDPVNKHDPSGLEEEEQIRQQLGCSNTHCQPAPFFVFCYGSRINTVEGSGCGGSAYDPSYIGFEGYRGILAIPFDPRSKPGSDIIAPGYTGKVPEKAKAMIGAVIPELNKALLVAGIRIASAKQLNDVSRQFGSDVTVYAFTIGTTIFVPADRGIGLGTLVHEITHVNQFITTPNYNNAYRQATEDAIRWGASNTGDAYTFNYFEMEARRNAQRVLDAYP